MNAVPIRLTTPELDEQDRIVALREQWDGHRPSPFDYQALLIRRKDVRLYQFPVKNYSRPGIVKRVQREAFSERAVAFLIRDAEGEVVHVGPVTDALGNPLEPSWKDFVADWQARRAA